MSSNPSILIQKKMDAVDRRWRWLKFWEYLFTAGAMFCLLWLGFELCAWREIVTAPWFFYIFTGLYIVGAIIGFVVIIAVITAREARRAWLAERLEKDSPGLLDRLNTLVFLEKLRRPYAFALKRRIEAQAAQVFEEQPTVVRFSPWRAWERLGIFALLLAGIIYFDAHYHPFAKILHPPEVAEGPKNDTPFELVPGNVNETTKVQKPWGEVRIVNPGRDVKLTKIDVLPLQIEMAASGTLQHPAWVTSINGGPEERHELPPSTEPQYAVYQPMIYLDELKVTDWDVISYYAKVETAAPAEYASQIYFIEIRPFREDIMKETGGGKGKKGRELLDELSALITQQTAVLQQTHQYQQTDYPTTETRKQDNKKLTDTESGISAATDHLYGKIVAENENAPIGDILDHLTEAEQQMNKATENLGEDIIPDAKQWEQGALTELIACRKSFMKVITNNPGAFGGGGTSDNGDDTPIASAQDSLKSLSQVTEMHDRDQAALDKLHDLNQQQHDLAQQASGSSPGPQTANSEANLQKQVEKLMQDNPDLFRASDSEKASLQSDMSQAIDSLNSGEASQGKHYLTHAAGDMNDLEKAVQKNHQLQQVAEAYKLKKIIDQNIQQLGQEKTKPGALSPQDIKDISDSAKRSTGTLKELTDTPGHDGFGPGLNQSLSPENQQALQKDLDQLGQSTPGQGSQGAAGTAQGDLAKVSQAFDQGRPDLSKATGQGQGGTSSGEGLSQAMQQLQGLILAEEKAHPPSSDDQKKEQGEILADLEDSLAKKNTPEATALLAEVKDMEKQKEKSAMPFNAPELKKLLDKLEATSAEVEDPDKDKPPPSEITVIDSSKFPASYRDRIRSYYEQLSRQPK